jgi:hypothetical protein
VPTFATAATFVVLAVFRETRPLSARSRVARVTRSGVLPKSLGLGPIIVYLASAINIALVVLVIVTAGRAVSGKLQAQEDFGVFMLIFGIGGPVSLVCLITVIVGALVGLRTPNFSAQLLKSPVAVLGIINCTVPFILLAAPS